MRSQATCDSCARETSAEELVGVHRAYFLDAEDPDPDIQGDVERWCASCRATYPHIEEGPTPAGSG